MKHPAFTMPTAVGRDGIHISAQLRIEAMQLQAYRVGWAAATMEAAAKHIDTLEDLLAKEWAKLGAAPDEQATAGT